MYALTVSATTPAVLSHYGMRQGRMHSGVDFEAAEGEPIYAVLPGTVTHSTINGAPGFANYGHTVVIRHDRPRVWTQYAHLRDLPLVKPGQQVRQGELLGYVGRTRGHYDKQARRPVPDWFHSSSPHLHFEVRTRSYPANPGVGTLEPLQFLAANGLPYPTQGTPRPEPVWSSTPIAAHAHAAPAGGANPAILAVLALGVVAATLMQRS